MMIWITMIMLALVAACLLVSIHRHKRPVPGSSEVSDRVLPIVQRSYANGLTRSGAVIVPESDESRMRDVTFAEETPEKRGGGVPLWESLAAEPVVVLGPEAEDGTVSEFMVSPPEILSGVFRQTEPDNRQWTVVDDLPEEVEPRVTNVTDEEQQAVREFDVRAFR